MRGAGRSAAIALVMLAPAVLGAQAGTAPVRSPYTDLEYRQEWSFFVGHFAAGKDPAGVAPRGGTMVGSRYDLRLAGPAYFTARVASVLGERTVLDPELPPATRTLGTESWPIYLVDVGFAFSLTGFKAWRQLVPIVGGGLGVASDFKGTRDVGQYQFGTPFAFNLGAGVKWVPPGRRWQVRVDVSDHFYQIKYPNTYYQSESGSDPILRPTQAKNFWKSNPSYTLGVSYLFFR